MLDFKTEVYPLMLEKLAENRRYFTKTDNNPNHIRVICDMVEVQTIKSSPNYEEIPYEMFEKTWQVLQEKGRVNQSDLSKVHYVKRSAFKLIAFDLLEEVQYKDYSNSLVLNNWSPEK